MTGRAYSLDERFPLTAANRTGGDLLQYNATTGRWEYGLSSPVLFPYGLEATPSITFIGDTNTGIWHPSDDDHIAISTAGTEAMRVDEQQFVGIGSTNPTCRLEVIQAGTNKLAIEAWTGGGSYDIKCGSNAARYRYIGIGHTGNNLRIQGANAGANGFSIDALGCDLILATNSATYEVRIQPTSGRLVAVGDVTPTHKVHILEPTGGDCLRLEGGGTYGEGAYINFGDADYAYIAEDLDDKLHIYARLGVRITGGYCGVGTLGPQSSLEVNGSFGLTYTSITSAASPYTAGDETLIECDCSGGAIQVDLPAISGTERRIYYIVKTDSSANAVTVNPNGAETVNGAGSLTISTQYNCAQLMNSGTEWRIV